MDELSQLIVWYKRQLFCHGGTSVQYSGYGEAMVVIMRLGHWQSRWRRMANEKNSNRLASDYMDDGCVHVQIDGDNGHVPDWGKKGQWHIDLWTSKNSYQCHHGDMVNTYMFQICPYWSMFTTRIRILLVYLAVPIVTINLFIRGTNM